MFVFSEDFFSYIKKPEKPAEVEQYLSDSDPIPCSQNRPQRQSAKNSGKMEAADTVETLISARTGITDDFYVDVSILNFSSNMERPCWPSG